MRWAGVVLLAAACGRAPAIAPPDAGTGSLAPPDAGTPPDAGMPPQALAVPDGGGLYHGVIPIGTGQPDSDISPSALDAYETAVGRKVAWVYFDDEWHDSRAFPETTVAWIEARGAVPFIRLMLRSQKVPLVTDPVFTLDRIIAGEFDGDLAAWAAAASAHGPLVVEYGTEVNGDWNPWSAPYNGGLDKGPALFQQAYRHIVSVVKPIAPNVTWALHYNSQNFPGDDARNVPVAYYPGDDVVDWVGISAYASERSNDHRCPSFRSLLDDVLPALPPSKPHFVFEFGDTDNNPGCPAPAWVAAAFDDMLAGRWPDLHGFSWWQQKFVDDPSAGGSTDYVVQDDPGVLAAFQRALASPKVLDAPLLQ